MNLLQRLLLGILTPESSLYFPESPLPFLWPLSVPVPGMSFGPTRNIYAWGFDRLFRPKLPKLIQIRFPVIASTIALAVAENLLVAGRLFASLDRLHRLHDFLPGSWLGFCSVLPASYSLIAANCCLNQLHP
jgi:hypothetical protein